MSSYDCRALSCSWEKVKVIYHNGIIFNLRNVSTTLQRVLLG